MPKDQAIFKDPAMRAFLVHLAAYVAVTLICAALNLWLTPGYPWFLWVLMGWGIGVAAHALALLLRKTRRKERIFINKKVRGFAVHAFAYVAVVLLLLLVNVTATPDVWWFYWVALGWGAGIAFHAWCALFKRHATQKPSPSKASKSQAKKTSHSKTTSRRSRS
jgi:hypothetical protein